MRTPGNTPGGLSTYFIGLIITMFTGLNLARAVHAFGGYFDLGFGSDWTFMAILAAMCLGIAIMFFDGKALIGQLLALGGLLAIIIGVLVYTPTYYRAGALWAALTGVFGQFVGVGLISRAVLPMPPPGAKKPVPPDHN